ncbi:alpha-ketoacid dehydrogenase subunit beta [Atrimonas thermophila]|jgi:pyruvate dehydrogenase E1 component beta subunit|uniref:alpha-ketoacid dehydrogenase subunit beta n=1 Tax=Atrimonas thermophila TaxID=3064161 RepID=UPI00399D1CFF
MPNRIITYAEALREAMREEMRNDASVFLIGEDIGIYGGAFGVTQGLIEEFGPERVIDTPISEVAIVGAAVGASLIGMRPVAEIMFFDFMTICSDQLVNQAAKIRFMFGGKARVPIVVRSPAGSGTGAAGHHSGSLESWFAHVPGLKVVTPATPYDAKGLLKSAIRDDNPVVFVEHKLLYRTKGPVPEEEYLVPIGKAEVKKEGKDVSLIAYSIMTMRSLEAAEILAKEGIEVEVVDIRSLRPLDEETILQSVKKTNRAMVIYEPPRFGGFGAEVASLITEKAFDYLDAPVERLGGEEMPPPYNPHLERELVPQVEDIVEAVKRMLE